MALRKIICIEDELLRKKSRPVEKFDEKLHKLLDDMAETMYNANGVGLAAPQVAVLRRVVVMDCGDGLIEMINPEILETEGEQDGRGGLSLRSGSPRHGQAPDEGARQISGSQRRMVRNRGRGAVWRAASCTRRITSTASCTWISCPASCLMTTTGKRRRNNA